MTISVPPRLPHRSGANVDAPAVRVQVLLLYKEGQGWMIEHSGTRRFDISDEVATVLAEGLGCATPAVVARNSLMWREAVEAHVAKVSRIHRMQAEEALVNARQATARARRKLRRAS